MSASPTRTSVRRILTVTFAVSAAVALSGCSLVGSLTGADQAVRDDDGTVIEGNDATDVFTLQVGDCVNDADADETVSSVPTVPCAEPHDSEIFASYILGDTAFPGIDAVLDEADAACLSGFESFIAIDYVDSRFDFSYYYPTESSWANGDREVLCLVYDPSGEQITGTLENARE